jgi:hypothetical protein
MGHAPKSAKECEGVNLHIPKWTPILGVGVPNGLEFSKSNGTSWNSLDWGIPYIIRTLLELRCLKWACMTHLDIWNISFGHKKGRESKCHLDASPMAKHRI